MTESTDQSAVIPEAEVQKTSNTLSRRRFLQLSTAGATALVLSPYIDMGAVRAEVEGGADSTWSGVDFVEGEPQMNGEVIKPEGGIFQLDQATNRRTENSTRGGASTATQTASGAIFEGVAGQVDLADLDPNAAYLWNAGKLVYENGQLVSDEGVRYVASNQGYFHYVEDMNTLPEEVQDLYRTTTELPDASSRFDIAQMDTLFDNIGGTIEFDTQMAQAWGKTLLQAEQPFEDTAVGAWQRSVTMVALFTDASATSQSENICEVVNSGGATCNYYRYIDQASGETDVITRFKNENDTVYPELYVVTRVGQDKKIKGVGIVTSAGLTTAYGQDGPTIAENTTAFAGEGVVQLVQEINNLEESKVFLPSLHRENQLAPKFHGAEGVTYNYQREGDEYYAVERDSAGEEVKRSFYIQGEGIEGEWIKAPNPESVKLQIERFAKAFKMREDEVPGFEYAQLEVNGEKIYFAHTTLTSEKGKDNLAGKVPLLKAKQDKSGEWSWTAVAMKDVAEGVNMKIGTLIEQYTQRYLKEMNLGVCYQEWGYVDNINDTNYRKGLGFQANVSEYLLTHIIEPTALPAEAASWSAAQAEEEIKKRVQEAMSVPGIGYYSIINEPGTVGGRVDQLERILGDKRYIEIACNEARRINPDAKLLLNDTINQTELARRLYGQGLIDGFGDQKHIMQYSSQVDQQTRSKQTLIDEFVAYGMPIMITELDINQTWMSGGSSGDKDIEQAKIARTVVDAAIESGVVIGINLWGMGDQDSWLVNENLGPSYESSGGSLHANPTPVDAEGNKKAFYFALTQGMYEAAISRKSSTQ